MRSITSGKKKSSDCLCQRVRADSVVFARLSFSEASLDSSWDRECWNDMKVVTFRLAWGHGRLNLIMATALDKSTHFLAAFLFVATTTAWEKLNKCAEVETNYDSGKQTWRSSLAIDDRQWWDLGLNSMWRLRWTSQRIVAAFLFVGETTKAWEKLRKLRQTKMEANCEAVKTWRRKPCFWRTKSSSLIADQISAPVLSAPTDLRREQIRWSTAPTLQGQTEPAEPQNRTPAWPLHLIGVCFWGQIERAPGSCLWGCFCRCCWIVEANRWCCWCGPRDVSEEVWGFVGETSQVDRNPSKCREDGSYFELFLVFIGCVSGLSESVGRWECG